MKLKRGIALLLAAVFLFGTLAVPASAAAAQPEPAAQAQTVDAEENDIISVRIKASGELTYGADHKLEIQTTPADAQYIGVVMGTSGQATGYVTLVLSEKIRILLKLIPLPKKMSATPDQTEEFNVYSYLKQLIDGNDVSVLLRVGDEAVSVLNIINFYLPSAYVKTIQNVSNGLKLALDLIRKYLPESAFTRIYLDEQPVDAGGYVAGAVALESGDINSAGVAMFKIKPQTSNVRLYWAGDLPGSLTAEELRNADRNAVLEADGQARSGEGVNISYTYKKKGFLWDKTCDGLPTKPGTYTQVAKVSGNYSCSEISRTFTIYQKRPGGNFPPGRFSAANGQQKADCRFRKEGGSAAAGREVLCGFCRQAVSGIRNPRRCRSSST
jgi:hypothetical protein